MSRVYGGPAGGYADWWNWSVVMNADCEWRETLRHEIAHLFAGRWNLRAPRMLTEGLAVWAQRTEGGRPIDYAARELLPYTFDPLACLLGPEPIGAQWSRYRYYVLAGSFTGFLIRRCGWRSYLRAYQTCRTCRDFTTQFEWQFRASLESVARAWITELDRLPFAPVPLQTSL